MERWVVKNKRADFYAIGEKFGIDPVIARLIRNRDVVEEGEIRTYLRGDLGDLHSPHQMKDMEEAASLLVQAIRTQEKIRIISDYDVDGVSSNYILYRGLRRCMAQVDYRIPHRVRDGYGINERLVREAYDDGIQVILTCDNGIAAYDEIQLARSLGMTVIVTDHHDVPFSEENGKTCCRLPPAHAVVNPKRPDCSYPFPLICGAVVAMKLVAVLYERFHKPEDAWQEFLEFAALATVCDVVSLRDENRILVKEGLKRINRTAHPGLSALIRATGLEGKNITSYHLGFVIGPCINASGRLQSAQMALELLLCEDRKQAFDLALSLKALNEKRKDMTSKGLAKAMETLEAGEGQKEDKVLVVYLPDCHESLAGIIAGRVREKYNKPVFVLTDGGEGMLKGSGRSIEAYSMFQEMSRAGDLMARFGGHPMAAGLTLPRENLPLFCRRLNELSTLRKEDFAKKVSIDMILPIRYLSENLVEQLRLLEPFGTDNPKPLFAQKNLHILSARVLGARRNVLKLRVADEDGYGMDALYFGEIKDFDEYLASHFGKNEVEWMYRGRDSSICLSVTYYPEVNEFRGARSLQIVIQNYQ